MRRNQLHALVLLLVLAGGAWLLINHLYFPGQPGDPGVCLFKGATGVPCPSCGTTRSVGSLVEGQPLAAAAYNPFGIILALAMVIFPPWILFDRVTGRDGFLKFYRKTESLLQRKAIALTFFALVLANWIRAIIKFM
jgi:hypothetical protein